jgi:hypothetical protein
LFAPDFYERVLPAAFEAGTYHARSAEHTPGDVLQPVGAGAIDGGWRRRRRELAGALADATRGAMRGLLGR